MSETATSPLKAYIAVYVALLVLVVVTVVAAMIPTGPFAAAIALAIAGSKAVLIVAVFMHAKDEVPLVRVFATAGAFWLMLMFVFLFGDYLTRHQNRATTLDAQPLPKASAIEAGPHSH